jgi:hypothetical protein
MNIISMAQGKISIAFNTIDVEVNGVPYTNLMFIVRLLSYDELKRVDSFNTGSELANLIIEDEVFNLVFEEIVGLDEEIILDSLEAGIVSTIAGTVIEQSYFYVNNKLDKVLEKEESEISVIDQMQFLISHSYTMDFEKVRQLPINEIFKMYAVIKRTFPALELKVEDQNEQ